MADEEKPQRPQADRERPKAEPDRKKEEGGHGKKKKAEDGQDPTLMPAAVYNLMIAQQYIDGTKFPIAHKLVSFHYGVALLAAGRDDQEKRNLAKEYLTAAAGWNIQEATVEEVKSANRILCESQYNLGVIEELNRDYGAAREHYWRALEIALGPHLALAENAPPYCETELGNVALLAHLGWISSAVEDLKREAPAKGADEQRRVQFRARTTYPLQQAGILRGQIGAFKKKAYEQVNAPSKDNEGNAEQRVQQSARDPIAVSYRHELLDAIRKRLDEFYIELDELSMGAGEQQA